MSRPGRPAPRFVMELGFPESNPRYGQQSRLNLFPRWQSVKAKVANEGDMVPNPSRIGKLGLERSNFPEADFRGNFTSRPTNHL